MGDIIRRARQPKIGGLAIFDLTLSMAGGAYIGKTFFNNATAGALLSIPAGIVVHGMFGINTPLNQMIFNMTDKITILDTTDFCIGQAGCDKESDKELKITLKVDTLDVKIQNPDGS